MKINNLVITPQRYVIFWAQLISLNGGFKCSNSYRLCYGGYVCLCVCTCLSSQQTGLVKGIKLRKLSLFAVTAGITVSPWGMLGAVVTWRGLATVAVVLTGCLRPDGNAAVWGCLVRRHHCVGAVQTPGGPMTCLWSSFFPRPMLSSARGGMGPRWLPERRERFPLPGGFQRGRQGWIRGRRGRRWGRLRVSGFKVCGVWGVCDLCIPETQRKRGQRDG